ELSARLRVSRPTLRTALQLLQREGSVKVAQGQRRRICQGIRRLSMRQQTTRVGLLTPVAVHRMPPFVMFWLDELRKHLADEGFDLDVHVRPIAETTHPERLLERLVKEFPVAAWVLFLSTEPMQRWFAARQLPCVITGSCFPGLRLPSVDVDLRAVCRHAAG